MEKYTDERWLEVIYDLRFAPASTKKAFKFFNLEPKVCSCGNNQETTWLRYYNDEWICDKCLKEILYV